MTLLDRTCRRLFDGLPEAVFLEDREGNILDVNRAACDLLGYEREDLLSLGVMDLIPEGSPTFASEGIDRGVTSGVPLETYNLKKDGSRVPVEIRGREVELGEGQLILVSLRDITRRKQSEAELVKSERKFRNTFESSPDPTFLVDEKGVFVDVNRRALEKLGYGRGEVVGTSLTEAPFFSEEAAETAVKQFEKRKQGEEIPPYELVLRTKGGEDLITEVNVTKFEDEEAFQGEVVIARDITSRKKTEELLKQSERRFKNLANLLPQPVWETDTDGNLTFANRVSYEKLGYDPGDLEQGIKITDLVVREDRKKIISNFKRVLRGEDFKDHEYTCLRKDGSTFPVLVYSSPIVRDGEMVGLRGITLDISNQKETEKSLERERERLRQLHAAVDRFQQTGTEEELYKLAIEVTREILGFDRCALYLAGENNSTLVPIETSEGEVTEDFATHESGEGIAGRTLESQETIWGDDIRELEGAEPEREDLKSFMSVPIGDIGVFQAASTEKGAFERVDVELAEILAGHLTEEIKRIRLEKELLQQAIRDPLTGLYNRRYFNESLSNEVERSERYGHNLAFLMIDVNRFKEINDNYSHHMGDMILQEVAELLEENVRDADIVVRYGGDEFLIMMPETNGDSKLTAARLREKLTLWNEKSSLLKFPLTFSIGVSHWRPDQDRSVEDSLKEADQRMYEEKRSESE